MYLVGRDHPLKEAARRALERAVMRRDRLVTDAEVYQEVLHRYTAISRPDAIGPAFDLLDRVVDEVLPVDAAAVHRARDLLSGRSGLSARDAVHAAVMEHHGIRRIMTFDTGFDGLPGIERIGS
jgi:predicted nucleic acid-binding protein